MKKLVTIGETMVAFVPKEIESLQYGPSLCMRIAGAESNTAIGIQKLGYESYFISRVGNDPFGQFILRMIRAEGVDTTNCIIDHSHSTGIMFKEPLPNQETSVYYYRANSAASHLTPEDICPDLFKIADILHFTGITPILSDSCRETIEYAIELALRHQCAISFDPNIRLKLWKNQNYTDLMLKLTQKSDYLFLGLDEAQRLYKTTEIEEIKSAVFSSSRTKCLAIKNGEHGAWVCDVRQTLFIPPTPCNCIDPIGAGDAFNSGFLSGILANKPLSDCGSIAAIYGAKATETIGDVESLIDAEKVEQILNNIQNIKR